MNRKAGIAACAILTSVGVAGCGGGGGGSSSGPTSPGAQSVAQSVQNANVVLAGARSPQAGGSAASPALRAHVSYASDSLQESLVFDSSGNPIASQCQIVDVSESALGTITAISLSSTNAFQETVSFPSLNETDTITGTLVLTAGNKEVELENGTDAFTIGGTTETVNLGATGAIQIGEAATSLAGLGITAGSYGGTVSAVGASGAAYTDANLDIDLASDGSFTGVLTYTDTSDNSQFQPIAGQVDANGHYFVLLAGDTPADNVTIEVSVTGTSPGIIGVSGAVFQGAADLTVSFTGSLASS